MTYHLACGCVHIRAASNYGVPVEALETQELRTTPVLFWLVCFSDAIKQLYFVVLLPDETVV
jgi:hypothetical protein